MKVARHYTDYIEKAREAENEGDVQKAIELYEDAIAQHPVVELPYTRLMILYRKEKKYKDELRIINKALAVYKEYYDEKTALFTGSGKLAQASKALLKSLTGTTKRTSYTAYPEPIPKWSVRKKALEKKIG
jgi:tetratricopeptide (TPR) repeat protein